MARVTYGALVTELKGSIAGTTFQNNPSGAIARSRPYTPVNPSAEQSDRQLALINLVAYWPTLSVANRNLWNALAAAHNKINDWGNYVKLNGYQWMMSYNLNAYTVGDAPWPYPQSYLLATPPNAFTLSADATKFDIDFPSTPTWDGYWAAIYVTQPMRLSSLKLRKSTFLLSVFHAGTDLHIHIKDLYEAFFNLTWADFYAASQCFIIVRMKVFLEDTGYASPFTSALIKIG